LITITINNESHRVAEDTTVAAALLNARAAAFRTSVKGGARGPLCGMGICFECRVTINGIPQQRSCTLLVADGMEITTDDQG